MFAAVVAFLAVLDVPTAAAQVAPGGGRPSLPDAGQLLRNVSPPEMSTAPKAFKGVNVPAPAGAITGPAAKTVIPVRKIRLEGNARISTEQLQKDIPDLANPGGRLTLEQLQELANKITSYYRGHGFIVAYAYLPPQTVENHTVTLRILEGQISKVGVSDSAGYPPEFIERYARQQLCPGGEAGCGGAVLSKDKTDRALGLINDLPGVTSATGLLSPGKELGSTNFSVDAKAGKRYIIALGADNYGQQYTGRARATASLLWNSPLGLGDRFSLDIASSGAGMTSGALDYSLPAGYGGWRAGVNYTHLLYTLSAPFNTLNAHGIADTLSPYATYALVRAPDSNATVKLGYIQRWIADSALDITNRKQEQAGLVELSGNKFDHFFGGGVTAYDLAMTFGNVSLGSGPAGGASNARGGFAKLAGAIQRDQTLAYFGPTRRLSLFLSMRGQVSSTNLTSVEQMSLGGPDSVRAYPVGEAQGDMGAIASAELRYSTDLSFLPGNNLTLALFRDQGWLQVSKHPWSGFTGPNFRQLGGTGIGVSLERYERYSLKASVAIRDPGGERDTSAKDSRLWFWLQGKVLF